LLLHNFNNTSIVFLTKDAGKEYIIIKKGQVKIQELSGALNSVTG